MKNKIFILSFLISLPFMLDAQCPAITAKPYAAVTCSVLKSGNTFTVRAVPGGTYNAITDNIQVEVTVPTGVTLTAAPGTIGSIAWVALTQTGRVATLNGSSFNNCFGWVSGTPVTLATFTFTGAVTTGDLAVINTYVELGGDGFTPSCSRALPLDLINFEAKSTGKSSLLEWKTASEENFEGFNVERSAEGKVFQKVGSVKSSGTVRGSYSFTDDVPMSGVNYYRLKMINTDGSFTYSAVRSVNLSEGRTTGLSVSPNPAKEAVTVKLNANEAKTTTLELVDIAGKVLLTERKKVEVGFNQLSLNLSNYPAGMYFLKVDGVAHRLVIAE